jgi:hypothetical protein
MGIMQFSIVSANMHFVGKIDLLSAILRHSGVIMIVGLSAAAKEYFRICSSKTKNDQLMPKASVSTVEASRPKPQRSIYQIRAVGTFSCMAARPWPVVRLSMIEVFMQPGAISTRAGGLEWNNNLQARDRGGMFDILEPERRLQFNSQLIQGRSKEFERTSNLVNLSQLFRCSQSTNE